MFLDFNPFDKDLDKITTQELEKLKNVSEGWYVEYKAKLTTPKKIAKSISAFANHYGGWLFYGINQAKSGSNVAGSFPGIHKKKVHKCLESIRNAVKDNINPTPYYETITFDGPCPKIGLKDEFTIIVVAVPIGKDSPYIHSDGRIYRRVADASDPKMEKDRFILDNLAQRRRKSREELTSFLNQLPLRSTQEDSMSLLHLYLMVDPLGMIGKSIDIDFDKFAQIMSNPKSFDIEWSHSFDNIYTTSEGFIARYIHTNPACRFAMTFKYYTNGSALISIPFSSVQLAHTQTPLVERFLEGFNEKDSFLTEIKEQKITSGIVVDINNLFYSVCSLYGHYKKLLTESSLKGPIYAKAAIENVWRRIPFYDTCAYIEYLKRYGFPILQFNKVFAPPGDSYESLIVVPGKVDPPSNGSIDPATIEESLPILKSIGYALGLPPSVLFDNNNEWFQATVRSMKVSILRSKNMI